MPRDIGFVVGSKGFKIQKINRETGAYAELRQANQFVPSPHFLIEGFNPIAVQNAWAMINQAACKAEQLNSTGSGSGNAKSIGKVNKVTKTEMINGDHAGLLIGPRGATVRSLKQRFNLLSMKIETDQSSVTTLCIIARTDADIDRAMSVMHQEFSNAFFPSAQEAYEADCEAEYQQKMNTMHNQFSNASLQAASARLARDGDALRAQLAESRAHVAHALGPTPAEGCDQDEMRKKRASMWPETAAANELSPPCSPKYDPSPGEIPSPFPHLPSSCLCDHD
jgi:hypothetical protein